MSDSFERYFIKQKQEALISQAQNIEKQYKLGFETGIVDMDKLNFEIKALNRYLNTRIWLINRNGEIYINSGIKDISLIKKEIKLNEIQKVFKGEIIAREGYFNKFFDEPVLTIGYPIKINNRVILALFMHAPIPEINKTISDIYRIAFKSLLVSTLIALILVFFISRNLTNGIKNLNDAVKIIAKGDFEKRLSINRKDELGQLANSFNEMASDLNKLEELRRRFISNLSHDLRTPLTTINGFVKAILDGTIEEEKQRRYLEIVAQESERLNKLTNDILDLSKMENGQETINRSDFNINELLLNEIDKFETSLVQKNIDVNITLEKEKYTVNGDLNKIERVVYNLIDNAVKFVNKNGKIQINTKYKNKKIYISIRNTGSKISPEDIDYIWDRFHKVDSSRGKDKGGSGLGLAIVKEIIKIHGEDIEVYSDHMGVEFVFTLSATEEIL